MKSPGSSPKSPKRTTRKKAPAPAETAIAIATAPATPAPPRDVFAWLSPEAIAQAEDFARRPALIPPPGSITKQCDSRGNTVSYSAGGFVIPIGTPLAVVLATHRALKAQGPAAPSMVMMKPIKPALINYSRLPELWDWMCSECSSFVSTSDRVETDAGFKIVYTCGRCNTMHRRRQ